MKLGRACYFRFSLPPTFPVVPFLRLSSRATGEPRSISYFDAPRYPFNPLPTLQISPLYARIFSFIYLLYCNFVKYIWKDFWKEGSIYVYFLGCS